MSKIIIKTADDIKKIRLAAEIWKKTKKAIIEYIKPGQTLKQIDEYAKNIILSFGAIPTFYKKYGFPGNICISVNECVIHGVPNNYVVKDKDIISIDIGITYQEHICDAAFTIIIGQNLEAQRISDVCLQAIYEATKIIIPNLTTNLDIAKTIQNFVELNNYCVIRDFTGHGCGNELHEGPIIPNYKHPFFKKEVLKPNMVICIEPMIMTDSNDYFISKEDGWSVIASNKKITCHWEHMILITQSGIEILTGE